MLVTGHTDTVGSDDYNMALSDTPRRVRQSGDDARRHVTATIDIVGKSSHDPLVPTGPGVREPQNRRAVIQFRR